MEWITITYKELSRYFNDLSINKEKNSIRIVSKMSINNRSSSYAFDYFELDENNKVTKCPRGYTKMFKGAIIKDIDSFPPTIFMGREL
jgi:hypothetical protein